MTLTLTTLNLPIIEHRVIQKALAETGGHVTRAAALCGISRRTMHRHLIKWPDLATNATWAKGRVAS